jgi:hypothetical protein
MASERTIQIPAINQCDAKPRTRVASYDFALNLSQKTQGTTLGHALWEALPKSVQLGGLWKNQLELVEVCLVACTFEHLRNWHTLPRDRELLIQAVDERRLLGNLRQALREGTALVGFQATFLREVEIDMAKQYVPLLIDIALVVVSFKTHSVGQ